MSSGRGRVLQKSVPADGTGLPSLEGSGDFGTSPFYGQLPGQVFIYLAHAYQYGVPHPQAQLGIVPDPSNQDEQYWTDANRSVKSGGSVGCSVL
jgi:hypothetical protein